MIENNCPYCDFDEYDVIDKNDFGAILPEPKPLSKGHSVIIPCAISVHFSMSLIKNVKV